MVSFSGPQLCAMVRSSSSTSSMEEYRGGGRMKSYRRTDPIAVVEDCKRNEFGYFDCPCTKRDVDGGRCKDRFLTVDSLHAHYFTQHYQLPGRHYCGACGIRFETHREREEHNYNVHFAKPEVEEHSVTGNNNHHSCSHNHHKSYDSHHHHEHTSSCTHSHSHNHSEHDHSYTAMNTSYCYDKSSADEHTGMSTGTTSPTSPMDYSTRKETRGDKEYDLHSYAPKKSESEKSAYDYSYTYKRHSYSYSEDYSNHGPVHTYQVNTADYYNSHVMKNNYNSYVDLKHSVHSGIDADNVQNVAFGSMTKNCNYKPSQHHLCHINHHMSHINHINHG